MITHVKFQQYVEQFSNYLNRRIEDHFLETEYVSNQEHALFINFQEQIANKINSLQVGNEHSQAIKDSLTQLWNSFSNYFLRRLNNENCLAEALVYSLQWLNFCYTSLSNFPNRDEIIPSNEWNQFQQLFKYCRNILLKDLPKNLKNVEVEKFLNQDTFAKKVEFKQWFAATKVAWISSLAARYDREHTNVQLTAILDSEIAATRIQQAKEPVKSIIAYLSQKYLGDATKRRQLGYCAEQALNVAELPFYSVADKEELKTALEKHTRATIAADPSLQFALNAMTTENLLLQNRNPLNLYFNREVSRVSFQSARTAFLNSTNLQLREGNPVTVANNPMQLAEQTETNNQIKWKQLKGLVNLYNATPDYLRTFNPVAKHIIACMEAFIEPDLSFLHNRTGAELNYELVTGFLTLLPENTTLFNKVLTELMRPHHLPKLDLQQKIRLFAARVCYEKSNNVVDYAFRDAFFGLAQQQIRGNKTLDLAQSVTVIEGETGLSLQSIIEQHNAHISSRCRNPFLYFKRKKDKQYQVNLEVLNARQALNQRRAEANLTEHQKADSQIRDSKLENCFVGNLEDGYRLKTKNEYADYLTAKLSNKARSLHLGIKNYFVAMAAGVGESKPKWVEEFQKCQSDSLSELTLDSAITYFDKNFHQLFEGREIHLSPDEYADLKSLIAERRVLRAVEQQREKIKMQPNIKVLYEEMMRQLTLYMQVNRAISTGRVKQQHDVMETFASIAKVIIPLKPIAAIGKFISRTMTDYEAGTIASLTSTLTEAEALAESIARKICLNLLEGNDRNFDILGVNPNKLIDLSQFIINKVCYLMNNKAINLASVNDVDELAEIYTHLFFEEKDNDPLFLQFLERCGLSAQMEVYGQRITMNEFIQKQQYVPRLMRKKPTAVVLEESLNCSNQIEAPRSGSPADLAYLFTHMDKRLLKVEETIQNHKATRILRSENQHFIDSILPSFGKRNPEHDRTILLASMHSLQMKSFSESVAGPAGADESTPPAIIKLRDALVERSEQEEYIGRKVANHWGRVISQEWCTTSLAKTIYQSINFETNPLLGWAIETLSQPFFEGVSQTLVTEIAYGYMTKQQNLRYMALYIIYQNFENNFEREDSCWKQLFEYSRISLDQHLTFIRQTLTDYQELNSRLPDNTIQITAAYLGNLVQTCEQVYQKINKNSDDFEYILEHDLEPNCIGTTDPAHHQFQTQESLAQSVVDKRADMEDIMAGFHSQGMFASTSRSRSNSGAVADTEPCRALSVADLTSTPGNAFS